MLFLGFTGGIALGAAMFLFVIISILRAEK
jgi:hypothetical protein